MRWARRDSLPIVVILALLTAAGYLLVAATGRNWFEHDVQLRAQLAVRVARQALLERWNRGDRAGVEHLLADVTVDERILAAAACTAGGAMFARPCIGCA